jgi:hypothetical protein
LKEEAATLTEVPLRQVESNRIKLAQSWMRLNEYPVAKARPMFSGERA